jgi:hypothetical protein
MAVRLYRLQGADLVLHGEEHTAAGMVVLRQPQAWWCTVVGPQSPDRPAHGSAA